MNERIRELAWEAKIGMPSDDTYWRTFMTSSDNIQKFAELIVKECAAMTRNLSAHGELAEKAVKEYFGVE